jgi:hypothetical protein
MFFNSKKSDFSAYEDHGRISMAFFYFQSPHPNVLVPTFEDLGFNPADGLNSCGPRDLAGRRRNRETIV